MRRLSLLIAVLFVVPLFGYDAPKEYEEKMAADGVEGTWRLVKLQFDGMKVEACPKSVMTLRNGTSTFSDGNFWPRTYQIHTARKPYHLDLIPTTAEGETFKCIYQIDGDTLRIAFFSAVGNIEKRRPQGFNEKDIFVETFKRVK